VHWHAIGVPKGITFLEFEPNPEEQPLKQGVQVPEEAAEGDVVDCSDHTPCNFVKGKPRSIISLLISEMQLIIMLYILLH
jgi:type VI protein secretion system component VasA